MDNETMLCLSCKKVEVHDNIAKGVNICRNCGFINLEDPNDRDVKYYVAYIQDEDKLSKYYPRTQQKIINRYNASLTEWWICKNDECQAWSLWENLDKGCGSVRCPKCGEMNLQGSVRLFKGCPICAKSLDKHYIHRDTKQNYVLSNSSKGDDPACFIIYPTKAELEDSEYFDKKRDTNFIIIDPSAKMDMPTIMIRGHKFMDNYIIDFFNEWAISTKELIEYISKIADVSNDYNRKLEIHIESGGVGSIFKAELTKKLFGSEIIKIKNKHVKILDSKFYFKHKMNHLDDYILDHSWRDDNRRCIYCGRSAHKSWRCCDNNECIAKELQYAKQVHEVRK